MVVEPACPHEALGFAPSAGERGVGGVGGSVGVWDGGARARDGGAAKGDAVGLVWGDGVKGVLAQVLEGGVGVKVALAVLVVAVGDGVGVGALGACGLGDGFACGGGEFGVCEVLEVVYWVCVVVLPIGLSHLGVSKSYHSMRDTRWVFCYSRGRGVGMLKMADFRVPP